MKALRIAVHGLALALVNTVAITGALTLSWLLRRSVRASFRVPAAVVISVIFFLIWTEAVKIVSGRSFVLKYKREYFWVFFSAFIWLLLIFIPAHYWLGGYLTSWNRIPQALLFQLLVNPLTLLIAFFLVRREQAG